MLYFKTSRIRACWNNPKLDMRLRFIILAVAGFVVNELEKCVTITSIFRQGDRGVHGAWRGVDLRSRIYTRRELKKIINFVNDHIPYNSGERYVTCLYHNVGACRNCGAKYVATLKIPTFSTCRECGAADIQWKGWHFHFQVNRGRTTILRK